MTKLFKNSKSVLSCVLAFAVLAVSLFTGVVISSEAAAADEGTIDLLEFGSYLTEMGSSSQYYDTVVADNGETGADWDNAIIIDSAEELVYLCKASGDNTIGKYYKVADGIAGFDLSKGDIDLDGTLADNIDKIKAGGKNHAGGTPGFQGHFDGNGATVYGAWTNHNEGALSGYAGLFSCTKGDVTVKNINVKLASFTAKYAAGGIVGYHTGDGTQTLTIENCSITDSHIEYVGAGNFGHGIGAILGYSANLSSWKESEKGVDGNGDGDMADTIYVNGGVNIKNCYVNLDEDYFISCLKPGDADVRGCHGGVAGFINTNAMAVSDCVVIGITPYATSASTSANDVQHSGLASHFANIYTTSDVAIEGVAIGGTLPAQNFTGKVFPLTDAQLKGAAAVDNMDLDWTVWMADSTGYPELANAHKDITLVDNEDGTHAATCACGFGGIAVDHTYVDGVCACGAELNCATRKTIYWDGTVASGIATGTGTKDDPYIIKSAAEFAWLVRESDIDGSGKHNSAGKYYEIDEAIGKIVLQPAADAEAIIALDSAAAVKAYFETGSHVEWIEGGWESQSFAGNFDGNGVTVYGLYSVSAANAGLFNTLDAGAAIKNIALKNSYLTSTASNYQVGGIAAVTSSASYGAKTDGAIWFEGCVVANNYMYNSSTETNRSGVVIGASGDVVYMDNCLVYGNDATYGESVNMAVLSGGNNSVIVSDSFVAPEGLELVDDGAETARYYNMIRNSIIFGTKPYNTAKGTGSRFNDPKCYSNVLTDADVATDTFSNGKALGATEEQIKTVAVADLATAELGDAWIKTDSYPELKSFHDEVFSGDATAVGAAGHAASCSCGLADSNVQAHVFVSDVEPAEWDSMHCEVCGYVCDHAGYEPVEYHADCVTAEGYTFDCEICGYHEEAFDEIAGHSFTENDAQAGADCATSGTIAHKYCDVCKKNYSVDADKYEPFENALTDITGDKGACIPNEDDSGLVYGADDKNHWTTCSVCNEIIETTAHTGTTTPNGAAGHMVVCDVCGYESDNAEHAFGDDSVCDTCAWECTHAEYVDGEETVLFYIGEGTPDACKKVEQFCAVCGTQGEDKLVEHTPGEWETPFFDRNKVPACASDGSHTELQACVECMFELATRPVTDPKTGHAFSEIEASDANCLYEGEIAHKYCPNCNYSFAMDAADDEAYENALTDEELYIPVDPEAHVWVEYEAGEADCENDGYTEDHKFCSVCHTFVIGEEATDIVVNYEEFYKYEYESEDDFEGTPVGYGAIADAYAMELHDEMFAQYLADLGVELPEEPAEDAAWEEWDAYYAEYFAIMDTVDTTAFEEAWNPILEAIVNEAYHQYFLEAAAADEENPVKLVIPATGHTIVKVDEVPATYDAEGTKAHYACEVCDKLFADAEGTEEVTAEELVIAKLVKEDDKTSTDDKNDNKTEGDNSDKSPATGESVAAVAAVAALMGAAFVLVRKAKKA